MDDRDIPILPAPNAATGDVWRSKRTKRTDQITEGLNDIVVPMAGMGVSKSFPIVEAWEAIGVL